MEVAQRLDYLSMRSSLFKARAKVYPKLPADFDEYNELINENLQRFGFVDNQPFYKGIVGQGINASIFFFVAQLVNVFLLSGEIHLDGTFKVVPSLPKSYQSEKSDFSHIRKYQNIVISVRNGKNLKTELYNKF